MLKALAIVTLLASIAAVCFQFMTDAMPNWFAWVGAAIGLVAGWAVAKTDRANAAMLQSPISVGLIIVGLSALLLALTTFNSIAILTIIAAIIGVLGAWWLWGSDWTADQPAAQPAAAVATAAAVTASASLMSEPEPTPEPKPSAVRAPEPEPAPKPAPKPAAKKAPAKKAAAKAAAPAAKAEAPAKKTSAKKEKFTTDAPKPKNLMSKKPAKAEIDDLKKVNGIGPVFEKLLHKNGIYTFAQLGAFTKKDVEWLSGQIDSFPDRIERKEWVKQAKALAKSTAKAKAKK